MEVIDVRTRIYKKEKLYFVTHIPGYVVCKHARRTPFVMRQTIWKNLNVFQGKLPVKNIHKPENVVAVCKALGEKMIAPTSTLSKMTGLTQVTVDRILNYLHASHKVYIADYDVGKLRINRTRLWALGDHADATVPASEPAEVRREKMKAHRSKYEEKREQKGKPAAQAATYRDPLTAAFFGAREIANDSLAALPSHVYRQAMDTSDELEAAA